MRSLEKQGIQYRMPRYRAQTAAEYETGLREELSREPAGPEYLADGLDLADAYAMARYGHGVSESAADLASEDYTGLTRAMEAVKRRRRRGRGAANQT